MREPIVAGANQKGGSNARLNMCAEQTKSKEPDSESGPKHVLVPLNGLRSI